MFCEDGQMVTFDLFSVRNEDGEHQPAVSRPQL